jgi:hypothetical protein
MRRIAIAIAFTALALALSGCTTAASPSPPVASPSPSPAASPSPSAVVGGSPSPCPPIDYSSQLSSQSLTDVAVTADGTAGTVTFTFGPPDPTWPAGPPAVEITPATPPFTAGASGLPIEVEGDHHIRVHFINMKVVDDTGTPLYDGPAEIISATEPIHAVVEEEAFEGVVNWLIGYDGTGCLTVEASADGLGLRIRIES